MSVDRQYMTKYGGRARLCSRKPAGIVTTCDFFTRLELDFKFQEKLELDFQFQEKLELDFQFQEKLELDFQFQEKLELEFQFQQKHSTRYSSRLYCR
jgi:hypothetical protein